MTVSYRFFSNGDYYNQPDFAKLLFDTMGTGVVPLSDDSSDLKVVPTTPSTMGVNVSVGRAYIRGYSVDVENEAFNVTIDNPDASYTRIDTVIARVSFSENKNIVITVKKGTAGSGTHPTMDQNENIWEFPLADVKVVKGAVSISASDITDRRDFCNNIREIYLNSVKQSVSGGVAYLTVPAATSSQLGIVRPGSNINVSNGTISVPIATLSTAGVVMEGNYCTLSSSGHINVDVADGSNPGVVCEGSGVTINDGEVINLSSQSTNSFVSTSSGLTAALDSAKYYGCYYIYLSAGTYDISTITINEWMNVSIILLGSVTFSASTLNIVCDGNLSIIGNGDSYYTVTLNALNITSVRYINPRINIKAYLNVGTSSSSTTGISICDSADVSISKITYNSSSTYGVKLGKGSRVNVQNLNGNSKVTYPAYVYGNSYCQIGVSSNITYDPQVGDGSICYVNGKLKSS